VLASGKPNGVFIIEFGADSLRRRRKFPDAVNWQLTLAESTHFN
jgi:hypothetical protein